MKPKEDAYFGRASTDGADDVTSGSEARTPRPPKMRVASHQVAQIVGNRPPSWNLQVTTCRHRLAEVFSFPEAHEARMADWRRESSSGAAALLNLTARRGRMGQKTRGSAGNCTRWRR